MPTNNAARTQAIYAAVAAQPGFDVLSQEEAAQVKASLGTIFGADLAYLLGHVTVQPTALQNPAGAGVLVSPTSGSGSVVQPTAIQGTATLT